MKTERKNEHYLALQQAFDAPWPGPVGELVTLEKAIFTCRFIRMMVPG